MDIVINEISKHLSAIKFNINYPLLYETKDNILQNNKIVFSFKNYKLTINNTNNLYTHCHIKDISFEDFNIQFSYNDANNKCYYKNNIVTFKHDNEKFNVNIRNIDNGFKLFTIKSNQEYKYFKHKNANLEIIEDDNFPRDKKWNVKLETIENKIFLFAQKENCFLQQQIPCLIDEIITKTVIYNNLKLILTYIINKENNTIYQLLSFYLQFNQNLNIFYEISQLTITNTFYQGIFIAKENSFKLDKLLINNEIIANSNILFTLLAKIPIRYKAFKNYYKCYNAILQFDIALQNEQFRFIN